MTSSWVSSKGISELPLLFAVVQIVERVVNLDRSCDEFVESVGPLLPNQLLLDLGFEDFFESCDVSIVIPVQVCDDLLKL